jgi:hypothetical protein
MHLIIETKAFENCEPSFFIIDQAEKIERAKELMDAHTILRKTPEKKEPWTPEISLSIVKLNA